jgi:16S rRNA (guanine527-N7)-methyltransferase
MLTSAQREQLTAGAARWNLILDEATLNKFARFAELLDQGNRRLNLTRIGPEDIVTLHFLDSLALAAVMKPEAGTRLLDVGTGAGFPGMPLALVFPDMQVCLLDGTRKRLRFLDEVIADLQLSNIRTLHGRAEEIVRLPQHRARYDLVTARAVAKLPELAGWLLPLVRPGGAAIAYKSWEIEEEAKEAAPVLERLGGKVERIAEVALPDTEIVRKLIILRKRPSAKHQKTATPAPSRRRS